MDASDAPVDQGVMIAFLPTTTHWSHLELPHMTLVYAGTKDKLRPSDYSALVKDAARIAMLTHPFEMRVAKADVFGDEDKVNVLRFRLTPELEALRALVERWNQSQHPFSPHVTIGSVTEHLLPLPEYIFFNRVTVGWGSDYTTFKL